MSFKLKNPKCPECGKTAHQVEEAMSQHTPGPWTLYTDHHPGRVRVMAKMPQGVFILANLDHETVDTSNPVTLANAHLIAAAPGLLDALKRCIANDGRFITDEDLAAARAAIAKAEAAAPEAQPLRPDFLTLDTAGERDVTLTDGKPFWLAVNGMSIYVRPIKEGVHVEVHEQGYESEGAPFGVIEGRKP